MVTDVGRIVEASRRHRRKGHKFKTIYISNFREFQEAVQKNNKFEILEEEDSVYLKVDVSYHDVGSGLVIGPLEYRSLEKDFVSFGPLVCLECENDLFYDSDDEYYCPKCEK